MKQYKPIKFESGIELATIAQTLDVGKKVPLFFKHGEEALRIPDKMGLINATSGEYVCTCSPDYALLQHRDIFAYLGTMMEQAGLDAHGSIATTGTYTDVRVSFRDIVEPGHGLELGGRFINSFNKTSSFRGDGRVIVLVCANGLVISRTIPELQFSMIHYAHAYDDWIEDCFGKIDTFVETIAEKTKPIELAVSAAKDIQYIFHSYSELCGTLANLTGSERIADEMVRKFWKHEYHKPVTKWDFLNVITAYATHAARMSRTRMIGLEALADSILDPVFTLLPMTLQQYREFLAKQKEQHDLKIEDFIRVAR